MAWTVTKGKPSSDQGWSVSKANAQPEAGTANRVASGAARSFLGNVTPSNIAQYIVDAIRLPSERGGRPDIAAEHSVLPTSTRGLGDIQANVQGVSRESLEPQTGVEKLINWGAGGAGLLKGSDIPLKEGFKSLAGAEVGGAATRGTASLLGLPEGAQEALGVVGEVAGGVAPHLLGTRGLIKQKGLEADIKKFETGKAAQLKEIDSTFKQRTKEIKSEYKNNLAEIPKESSQRIDRLNQYRDTELFQLHELRQQKLAQAEQEYVQSLSEIDKSLANQGAKSKELRSKGAKGLNEAFKETQGISGPSEELIGLKEQINRDIELGVGSADQRKIRKTLAQIESKVEDGSLSLPDAQTFYKNLGKQTHKGRNPDITGTVAQYNKKIQDSLSDYITQNGGDAGKKWLNANADYRVGSTIKKEIENSKYLNKIESEKKLLGREYKNTIKDIEKGFETSSRETLKDYNKTIEELQGGLSGSQKEVMKAEAKAIKEAQKEYKDMRKDLSSMTYEDHVKAQQAKTVVDLFNEYYPQIKGHGYDAILAKAVSYTLGVPHWVTQGALTGKRLAQNEITKLVDILRKNPSIKNDIRTMVEASTKGQKKLFQYQATKVMAEIEERSK